MKYILLLITLAVNCSTAFAQKRSTDVDARMKAIKEGNGTVEIKSPERAAFYFDRATKCLANEDSLVQAFNLFQCIYYFDSTSQLAKQSEYFLDSIHNDRPYQLKQQLLGNWRWLQSGSNWGVGDTPAKCNCEKEMVFDESKVHFIENGREVGVYDYSLVPFRNFINYVSGRPKWDLRYVVEVKGLDEKWNVRFHKPGVGFYADRYFKIKNASLFVNRMYNCSCGCPEELYEKIDHY